MFKNNVNNNLINMKMNVLMKMFKKKSVLISNNYKKNRNNVWTKLNKLMKNQMKVRKKNNSNKKNKILNSNKKKNKLMIKNAQLIKN